MAGEYNDLTAVQQLRVNAHIIDFFDRGSEAFIDEYQRAVKGVYQSGDFNETLGPAQKVLDLLRDELAANWENLPALGNETSGLGSMQNQLRRINGALDGEVRSDVDNGVQSYGDAAHYARITNFFDNRATSRPTEELALPNGFLITIQDEHGLVSTADVEAARLAAYQAALEQIEDRPVVGEGRGASGNRKSIHSIAR